MCIRDRQCRSRQRPQHVARHNVACGVGHHRAVGVAIGGNQRVEPVFGTPERKLGARFGIDRLGIDGDENIGARQCDRPSTKGGHRMPQNIAGNRAVFVDANGQALKLSLIHI